ncbi:hypothetical protein NP233_g7148 [Leucocoprinus birnbaumii]|uniref:Uncharacterized protein n=1 Tax=Leucocoprinus birnbaumii TaxID=56174 RepID=A0AAD5VPU7_9AGAR|nr:hypothetical protein NP233_g7148 [Leucocoprinus birnbaumii]
MKFWNNLKTCGAYFIYLLALLWLLTKEFLGYSVDWSHCPSAARRRQLNSRLRPGHVSERSKDLEANLDSTQSSASSGSDSGVSDSGNEKGEKAKQCYEQSAFVIYEAHPGKKAGAESAADCGLPVYHPAQASQTGLTTPTATQSSPPKTVSHLNPKIDGVITAALKDSLREHQTLEEATLNRLNFVKGLKYTENSNFKFPTIISAIRARSQVKSRRTSHRDKTPNARVPITPEMISPPIRPGTPTPMNQRTRTPAYPPPLLSRTASAGTSASSYSSTYTITSLSGTNASSNTPGTPPDDNQIEDPPINYSEGLPKWRRDPERAKYVFASLARNCSRLVEVLDSDSNLNSKLSRLDNDDDRAKGLNAEELGVSGGLATIVEETESGLSISKGFESMIIAMGLAPLLPSNTGSLTSASPSTLTTTKSGLSSPSPSSASSGRTGGGEKLVKPGVTQDMDVVKSECEGTGAVIGKGLGKKVQARGRKSRESVMSDVLSWVESPSSGSIVHAQ